MSQHDGADAGAIDPSPPAAPPPPVAWPEDGVLARDLVTGLAAATATAIDPSPYQSPAPSAPPPTVEWPENGAGLADAAANGPPPSPALPPPQVGVLTEHGITGPTAGAAIDTSSPPAQAQAPDPTPPSPTVAWPENGAGLADGGAIDPPSSPIPPSPQVAWPEGGVQTRDWAAGPAAATSIDPSPSPVPAPSPPPPSVAIDPSPSPPGPPPQVVWPEDGVLTRDWVAGLTATLDWCSRSLPADQLPSVLTADLVKRLVLAASVILHREPNIVRVDPRPDQAVVVVGDVHGQLHDVIFLLQDAGFPSEERIFVFNGDYVDRGAWGLETFLILLAWKVFLPNRVFLLRGNHESKYCTSVYGFEQEVMVKYKSQGAQVYRKFLRCFEDLPLATIIAGCVYTAHGGIFRGAIVLPSKRSKKAKKGNKYKPNSTDDSSTMKLGSLDELLKARRTVLDPPWEGSNLIPGDVLWSDPSLDMGLSPNNERGIGLLWGPDITQQFLYRNNLKLIIRSHEGPDAREKRHDLSGMDKGYAIDHQVECGKLITLFSAPDYPQFQASEDRYNNCGAYIVLSPPDFAAPVFCSFAAVKPRPAANPFYDFEEVIDSDEELNLGAMDTSSS